MKKSNSIESIEKQRLLNNLGYEFNDISLFNLALTHRSFAASNNERLEFLGDSILNFIIAEALFRRFPRGKEGQLSRLRAQLVQGTTLAEIARDFNIGDSLILGTGELKSGGFRRESILADAVEAIIAAIYLDGGMDVCRERVLVWYQERLEKVSLEKTKKDAKTRLQEFLQAQQIDLPVYTVTEIEGEAHAQIFRVECEIALLEKASFGEGKSRREAEQIAAKAALKQLRVDT